MEIRHYTPTVLTYAKALLEVATERGQQDELARELEGLADVMRQTPSFQQYLIDPGISESHRDQVIDRIFKGRVSPLLENFLRTLNLKGRFNRLGDMIDAYQDLLEEQQGRVEVDLTVAQRLSNDELEQVRQQVGKALGKEAVVHQYVDENIIGGMILRVNDRLIDGSVSYQLQAMRRQMLAARPR